MQKDKKKAWNRTIALGFPLLLTGIGLISMVIPEKGFSESENRYLQKKPEFTWETLLDGSFGTAYESYLSDQFPGRDGWVGIKTLAERVSGKRDANGVYFGKDGYLIEKFEMEDIRGEQLEENLEILAQALKRWEKEYGADHVRVMLVPGASQILTEKLPSFAAPYDQSDVVTELEKKQECEELTVPVEDMLKAHGGEPVYYSTDHHWTTLGAYYGYTAWAESVGLDPWGPEQFKESVISRDFLGTLYSKVQGNRDGEEIKLFLPKERMTYQVQYDENGIWTDGLYAYDALQTRDQYAVFLDGNHGLTRIKNTSEYEKEERKGKKLLIVKDSYAHSFVPFAVNHFEETLMVDLRYFNAKVDDFARQEGITDMLVLYRIPGFSVEKTVSKLR